MGGKSSKAPRPIQPHNLTQQVGAGAGAGARSSQQPVARRMSAKPDNDAEEVFYEDPNDRGIAQYTYNVAVERTGDRRLLTIEFPYLKLYTPGEKKLLHSFPIKFLRGYGQAHGIFSFEAGRKCPGGVGTYFFRVEGKQDVYADLNSLIASRNGGVAGDRYDHIPRGKRPSQVSTSSSSSEYNHLSASPSHAQQEQPTYNTLARGPIKPANSVSPEQPVYNSLGPRDSKPASTSSLEPPVYNSLSTSPRRQQPPEEHTYQ